MKKNMGNIIDSTHNHLDQTAYEEVVNQYLTSIGILSVYDPDRTLNTIKHTFTESRHMYTRQCVLRFLWPQCLGVPMIAIDLDANSDIMWWVHMFQPYVDYMVSHATAGGDGVFMFLGWSYLYDEHLTVLHFDPIHRIQTFFDPMQHFTQMMSGVSLATGYTTHTKFYEIPLQSALEWYYHDAIPLGVCSAICMLMVVCCRRFGTCDIYGINDIVTRLVWNRQYDISTIRYNLWMFYIRLGRMKTLPDLLRHLGLVGPTVTGPCTAAVQHTNATQPCNEPSCAESAYCPVHMQRLLASDEIKMERQPGVVVIRVGNVTINRSACLRRSAWTAPGPRGMAILNENYLYVQLERALLSECMAILKATVEGIGHHSLLYVRITGFAFPEEEKWVSSIIKICLDMIAQAVTVVVMDLCIDIHDPKVDSEEDVTPVFERFIRRTQSIIHTIKPIRTATLLLRDTPCDNA